MLRIGTLNGIKIIILKLNFQEYIEFICGFYKNIVLD